MSSTDNSAKRKYITIGREGVLARRAQVAQAAREFLNVQTAPVRQAEIFKAVTSATGLPEDPKVWNDLSLALEELLKSAHISRSKADSKRATYTAVEATAEETAPAAVEA